jgi:hypothetical protein
LGSTDKLTVASWLTDDARNAPREQGDEEASRARVVGQPCQVVRCSDTRDWMDGVNRTLNIEMKNMEVESRQ